MQHGESIRAGDILDGKYLVEALIGRGGMGSVFRARHIRLNSPRAIKLMRAELADDEDFVRRFKNEALLAEGVRHPNVVALYDFATLADGTRYIVWEYVEGETIGDLLSRGATFSSQEVRDLVGQVADGLSAAHQKGVLHRDVSPDNIMLFVDEQGSRVAKLLDFGLAKAVGYPASVPSNPSVIFGKIGFASPEQMGLLGNEERIDERTDIFSLAAVAYAMLTGTPPFSSCSLQSFLHELMIAPEEELRSRIFENLPPTWRQPLTRALSRDRDQRPPTVEAFLDDVDEAARPREHGALSTTQRRFRQRLSKRAAQVSLVTSIFLLGGGTFLVNRSLSLGPMPSVPELAEPTPVVPPSAPAVGSPRPEPAPPPATAKEGRGSDAVLPPPEKQPEPIVETEAADEPGEEGNITPPTPTNDDSTAPTLEKKKTDEEQAPRPPQVAPEPESPPPPPPEPRRIQYVEPVYPPIAVRLGVEGDVVVKVRIDPEGNVTVVGIEHSVSSLLDRAALEAVQQWKYAPGEAPVTFPVTVTFKLR